MNHTQTDSPKLPKTARSFAFTSSFEIRLTHDREVKFEGEISPSGVLETVGNLLKGVFLAINQKKIERAFDDRMWTVSIDNENGKFLQCFDQDFTKRFQDDIRRLIADYPRNEKIEYPVTAQDRDFCTLKIVVNSPKLRYDCPIVEDKPTNEKKWVEALGKRVGSSKKQISQLKRIDERVAKFREELAQDLAPLVTELVWANVEVEPQTQRELVDGLNSVLHDTGLAIPFPELSKEQQAGFRKQFKEGEPCSFRVGTGSGTSRTLICLASLTGNRGKTPSIQSLFKLGSELSLMSFPRTKPGRKTDRAQE